jgi:RNA polymerase sigma-70 factor, ECF subfamily
MNGPTGQTSPAPLRSKQTGEPPVQALAATDSLLGRCVAGDRAAWRELHRTLHPAVVSFLRQMGVGAEDVDDVCQDVFLQVARYLPRFEQRAQLKTWVYKICASQAGRLRRKRALWQAIARVLALAMSDQAADPGASPSSLDAQREMERALSRMSTRQRLVFVLYELHGLRGEEIARVIGCPPATVRGRLREARRLFSETANREEETP